MTLFSNRKHFVFATMLGKEIILREEKGKSENNCIMHYTLQMQVFKIRFKCNDLPSKMANNML